MTKAVQKESPVIYGDGTQSRDFVFVADVVRAIRQAASSPAAAGQAINIGSGRGIDIKGLWRQICQISARQITARYADPRPGDIHASLADIDKADAMLGFSPRVSFAEGLKQTLRQVLQNAHRLGQP